MKSLLLVRHAKSSWDDPDWTDFDRPLNKRGLREAPEMAAKVKDWGFKPEFIISSPANRAIATARIFSEDLGYPADSIVTDIGIYERGAKYVVQLLAHTDNKYSQIALFGHNPDITSLVSYFSGNHSMDVPTCGCILIDFDIDRWRDVESVNGVIRHFERPRK